jgi:tetratricopeptide (TPR) repeat protein
VGECVRQARLKLIQEYGIGAIGWLSYILYGDPHFVLFRPKPKAIKPMLKLGARVYSYRRQIMQLLLAITVILAGLSIWLFAPSINPNTYLLFSRAQKLYSRGDNEGTVRFSSRIIQKEPLFLGAYPLLADAYQRLGKNQEALKTYFDYALSSQKRHDNKHLVSAYVSIGWSYHLSGDYNKALDFYNRALTLSQEKHDKFNEAVALRKLAVWYIDKEDYDKALELLTKSSEINRQRQRIPGYRYNLACDYFDIGLTFANKNDFDTAKNFYHKSQELFEKMKLKNELSDCYFNLGEIYLLEKQYQKAQGYYLKGLKIDELHRNKPSIAADYNMLGELYLEMGKVGEAGEFFNKAILLSQEINAPVELAAAYYNLGVLYKGQRDKGKSREYFRQAQEIYRKTSIPSYQKVKSELIELNNLP